LPLCETDQGCPKESPEKEREHLLSDRNRKTVDLYLEVKTLGGVLLTAAERGDPLLRRNLSIVDRLYRQWEREREAELLGIEVANNVAALFIGR
jgi:hypothetical protein